MKSKPIPNVLLLGSGPIDLPLGPFPAQTHVLLLEILETLRRIERADRQRVYVEVSAENEAMLTEIFGEAPNRPAARSVRPKSKRAANAS